MEKANPTGTLSHFQRMKLIGSCVAPFGDFKVYIIEYIILVSLWSHMDGKSLSFAFNDESVFIFDNTRSKKLTHPLDLSVSCKKKCINLRLMRWSSISFLWRVKQHRSLIRHLYANESMVESSCITVFGDLGSAGMLVRDATNHVA